MRLFSPFYRRAMIWARHRHAPWYLAEMHCEFRVMREEMRRLREEIGGLRKYDGDTTVKAANT